MGNYDAKIKVRFFRSLFINNQFMIIRVRESKFRVLDLKKYHLAQTLILGLFDLGTKNPKFSYQNFTASSREVPHQTSFFFENS